MQYKAVNRDICSHSRQSGCHNSAHQLDASFGTRWRASYHECGARCRRIMLVVCPLRQLGKLATHSVVVSMSHTH